MSLPGNKTPEAPVAYESGPALVPRAALLAWIDAQVNVSPPRLTRVPVTVRFGELHRSGLGPAWIGVGEPGPETIALDLDDGALGIALVERVNRLCPDPAADRCALWLEGRWGPLVGPAPTPGSSVPRRTLAVLRVGAAITGPVTEEHARLHVERRAR